MRFRRRDDPCVRYRPALTDWVEHRVTSPATVTAFDHLERCRRCEIEITELAQTVVAVRRLASRAAEVDPPSDGWRELRGRLEANERRPRSSDRWGLAGSMLGPAVVAVLALRIAIAPVAPVEDVPVGDATRGPSSSTLVVRPLYDTGSGRLTEAIVLVLTDGPGANAGSSVPLSLNPSSTDRRDRPMAIRRAVARPEPTPPRSASRS